LEEWKVIFGEKQDVKMEGVKSLLGVSSLKANKKIHDLEYDTFMRVYLPWK